MADEALSLVARDVDAAYDNQKAVEAALRRVQALLTTHAHHVGLLDGVMAGLVTGLKELGDVGNWAQAIERLAGEVAEIKVEVARRDATDD